jgi:hypothetical protein
MARIVRRPMRFIVWILVSERPSYLFGEAMP